MPPAINSRISSSVPPAPRTKPLRSVIQDVPDQGRPNPSYAPSPKARLKIGASPNIGISAQKRGWLPPILRLEGSIVTWASPPMRRARRARGANSLVSPFSDLCAHCAFAVALGSDEQHRETPYATPPESAPQDWAHPQVWRIRSKTRVKAPSLDASKRVIRSAA